MEDVSKTDSQVEAAPENNKASEVTSASHDEGGHIDTITGVTSSFHDEGGQIDTTNEETSPRSSPASREKEFDCAKCGKCFNRKHALLWHVKSHLGSRPFSCAVCGSRFCRKDTLETHERIYSGEKPFPCAACGSRFSTKSNLKRHEKIHLL
ncbi:unnamed protein product, partial [Cyprideis torosa]